MQDKTRACACRQLCYDKRMSEQKTMLFSVDGMHCASCAARVERIAGQVPGIKKASVNLVTRQLCAVADPTAVSPETIAAAVAAGGYSARYMPGGEDDDRESRPESAPDRSDARSAPSGGFRLLVAILLLLPIFYLSMGGDFGLPLPGNAANASVQAVLATAILVLNERVLLSGLKRLVALAPDMNSLIALGSLSAYLYGWIDLPQFAAGHAHGLYFESAATIVTLICLGKYLEGRAFAKSRDAVESLRRLMPETATVLRGDRETTVPVRELREGDIVVVKTGESFPVDGTVVWGRAAVDQSTVTGESMPVDREEGEPVISGTIVSSGTLRVRAEHVGRETTLARMIRLVREAGASKAPSARLADRISLYFVPSVIALALAALAGWLLAGQSTAFAWNATISVLVISCPCALGLATPIAVMAGTGRAARMGVLYKSASAMEQTASIDTVVFDKTGTLTEGKPRVAHIETAPGGMEAGVLFLAAALEHHSEHPIARAVTEAARERGLAPTAAEEPDILPGLGVAGTVDGKPCLAGNARLLAERGIALPPEAEEADGGEGTPVHLACGGRWAGSIFVRDTVRPDARAAVTSLQRMGLAVVLLTGDRETVARSVAAQLGIADVKAGVLPDGKTACIEHLKAEDRRVAMVGDGVNDAPALASADLGIAIGSGTHIAMDAAGVVLMNNSPADAAASLQLGRAVVRNIRENLFWAFFYNVLGIPLAAGLFYPAFGWRLNPMIASLAMSASSLFVVGNSLRLLRFSPGSRAS